LVYLFTKSKHLDELAGGGGGDFSENFEMKNIFWKSFGEEYFCMGL